MLDCGAHIFGWVLSGDRSVGYGCSVLAPDFTLERFYDWANSRLGSFAQLNMRLQIFGHESLLLYYLSPCPFSQSLQTTVNPLVRTEAEFNEAVSEICNTTRIRVGDPMYQTWFFPNFERGPAIIIGVHHTLTDGDGIATILN
jgi:hypothetical protein